MLLGSQDQVANLAILLRQMGSQVANLLLKPAFVTIGSDPGVAVAENLKNIYYQKIILDFC